MKNSIKTWQERAKDGEGGNFPFFSDNALQYANAEIAELRAALEAKDKALDDLHRDIFNLRCEPKGIGVMHFSDSELRAYKIGHRDARHAAVELINEKAKGQTK